MKSLILVLILLACSLSACITTTTTTEETTLESRISARAEKVLSVATRLNDATGRLMKLSGPTVVAAYCVVQPQACTAATTAYTLALGAQQQYAKALQDMTAANAAPDGVKLATLAANFQTRFAELATLTGKTDMATVTEFQAKLAELRAETEVTQ